MRTLEHVLLVVHLLGFAALFGGALVQVGDTVKVVNRVMLDGALVQVVTGLLLVGVLEGENTSVDNAKVAVKLGIALVIALLCWVNRSRARLPAGLFTAVVALTVAEVVVAVAW